MILSGKTTSGILHALMCTCQADFWARVLCSLASEDACFRMKITLGVVLLQSLVFHVCVLDCSRNGSGKRPYLWVQEKIVYIRQGTQNAGLCPSELLWQLLLTLLSISSGNCVIYSSLILGTDVFRDWPFLGCSSCVSLVTAANFRLFFNVAILLKGKRYAVLKNELVFLVINLRL